MHSQPASDADRIVIVCDEFTAAALEELALKDCPDAVLDIRRGIKTADT
jgi:hypothetical protein